MTTVVMTQPINSQIFVLSEYYPPIKQRRPYAMTVVASGCIIISKSENAFYLYLVSVARFASYKAGILDFMNSSRVVRLISFVRYSLISILGGIISIKFY